MKLHNTPSFMRISSLFCILLGFCLNIYALNEYNPFSLHSGDEIDIPSAKVLVVIDPGHGGYDKGCIGHVSHEKDVNLLIAKELKQFIENSSSDLEVILTRDSDSFISLEKRVQIANQNKADIFLSIHCNSIKEGHATGSETHIAGLDFVNADQHEYLKRHNFIHPDALKELKKNPISNGEKMVLLKHSLDLAEMVQSSLHANLPYKSRGIKESGFTVLKYLRMAGVLVEVGFLSNKNQEKYINSSQGIQEIALALGSSLNEFIDQTELKKRKKEAYDKFINQFGSEQSFLNETYTIELLITKGSPLLYFEPRWDELESIYIVRENDHYFYRTGYYSNFQAAENAIPSLNQLGFDNLRIVNVPAKN